MAGDADRVRGLRPIDAMAEQGNPASASDAGVGALCARAAIRGAWLNVRTNATGIEEQGARSPAVLAEGARLDDGGRDAGGGDHGVAEAKM